VAKRRRRRLLKLQQLRRGRRALDSRLSRQNRIQSYSRKITMRCAGSKRTCGASYSTSSIRLTSNKRSMKNRNRGRRKRLRRKRAMAAWTV
jgi:hypothetical protein